MANQAGIFHRWSKNSSWTETVILSSLQTKYNTRQKSWNTCVCFPFPMLIWVSQWSQCFKTPVAQHWGGRRHISGGKTVWSRNLRIFPENSRETVSVSTICDEYCLCVWRAWTGNVTVKNLIRSMPKRIDMVIRNQEKRIKILKKYDYRISILWITAWDFFSQNVNFQRQ